MRPEWIFNTGGTDMGILHTGPMTALKKLKRAAILKKEKKRAIGMIQRLETMLSS